MRLDLQGGQSPQSMIERLVGLGASPANSGQGQAPEVMLADPEGTTCWAVEERAPYVEADPLATLRLNVVDP